MSDAEIPTIKKIATKHDRICAKKFCNKVISVRRKPVTMRIAKPECAIDYAEHLLSNESKYAIV